MEITGKITTGLGKGAYFIGMDFYKNKFNEKLGFTPYSGTLNIILDEKYLDEIVELKNEHSILIKGENDHGSVRFIKAILNDKIEGAIVFPDKTVHEENYLEFIALQELRKTLKLSDNEEVKLKILL
ncbi:DUF120 domain-containing protein [Methanobrevibacter curvatus]|uniref:Riboflavin kinase n=1 Tax=Methanobrevibacter curvatus TaxID=49547 RepID=A0A166BAW1_9EURY|nr:DUF120 domain-containing protein [Methanobrevibacter curvatus]KZX13096.1 hypothetical protein MBCUR_07840 [Methanobrevibacter curvatus]